MIKTKNNTYVLHVEMLDHKSKEEVKVMKNKLLKTAIIIAICLLFIAVLAPKSFATSTKLTPR